VSIDGEHERVRDRLSKRERLRLLDAPQLR
jgi:hypothetical protein